MEEWRKRKSRSEEGSEAGLRKSQQVQYGRIQSLGIGEGERKGKEKKKIVLVCGDVKKKKERVLR